MKKILFIALAYCSILTASAQPKAIETADFFSNWSIGVDGGVTTPLEGHAFWGDMRGAFGLHIQKQITPIFGVGVEGVAAVNTSSWNQKLYPHGNSSYVMPGRSKTAIDNMYVGVYSTVNVINLIKGYNNDTRLFDVEAVAGLGWGHDFYHDWAFFPYTIDSKDQNYLVTKLGVNLNLNVCENLTVSLKPYVAFNMTGNTYEELGVAQTSAAYDSKKATFNILAGITYNFGPGFKFAETKNQGEIDALNAKINALRGELDACLANTAANNAKVNALKSELEACKNRKPQVIEKVSNNLQSVRYIFYKIGSSKISADQQPNVEMVANYLKNHKDAKVVVKGYASKDGNAEYNKKLAEARAESVKDALVKKYKIEESRIEAKGEGIGEMFSENDWNRVSICTLED